VSGRHRRGLTAAAATLLASAPLAAIYAEWAWLARSTLAVGIIAAAALAARALRAPVWAQVVAMLGALTAALTWQFPSGEEVVRFIPGTATIQHFGTLLGQLPADVREHAAPVPTLESLLLVTVAGVGLVAILVDVFVAGLRRPALAGLPMLAIYSVPVAVSFDSVPVLLFAIGACGFLWVVASDNIDRVRRFGRRFTGEGRDVATWAPSPLAAAGRRLAVVGVLIAVVLPLGVPGMTDGLVDRFGPGLGGGGTGGGGSGQMNLFAQLHGQLNLDETVDLVRLTADDPAPFYLRIATADQITSTGFEPSPPAGRPAPGSFGAILPAVPGVTYHRHRAEVELTDAYTMFLAPIYPKLVGVERLGSGWRFDEEQQVVFSTRHSAAGLRYGFDYARPEYDPDALRRAAPLPAGHEIQQRYSSAPEVPEVRVLLDDLVDSSAAPYDQVREILAFFSRANGFRYDLETGPATDAPAIVDFLEHRVGFCVQYAAAMAWLVRSMDIPARVAFGFTRGTRSGESRVLTNRNMHAWTEVYFGGFGWVPFDPTPGAQVTGSTTTGWAPSPDAPPDSETPDGEDSGDGGPDLPDADAGDGDAPFPDEDPDLGAPVAPPDSRWPWFGLAAALAVLLVLALPAFGRTTLRRHRLAFRPSTPAAEPAPPGTVVAVDAAAAVRHHTHAVWDELLDTMVDLRLPLDLSETPRATAERLARHLAASAAAYRASRLLGQAEERARYARAPQPPEGLAPALRTLRRELRASSTPAVRLRAVLLPPSTLLRWRQTLADAIAGVLATGNRVAEWSARLSPRHLLRATR
jgi:transglutaminase-like putative cysteine protease